MKKMKQILALSLIASLFAACSDDDSGNPGDNEVNGVITSLNDPDYNPQSLKGDIEGNISLAAGQYILDGPLVVKDGYTLTIQPGATFKATAGGTNVYLVVDQGGKIMAEGEANNPIVFTSNATNPNPGDWGGIILCGYAPISGGGTAVTEVVDHIYGGNDAHDDSGVLSHVRVEYSGARINGEKEFNGITFYGVGDGTTIKDVAVFNGDDDSVEFFGGTVNVTNLLCVNAKDDLIDWTQGFMGTIDNAYAVRESSFTAVSEDPRGIEADGNLDGLSPNQSGQSNPTIHNLTIANNSTAVFSDIIKIRRGSGVMITNGLIKWSNNAATPGDLVDCTDSLGDAAGSTNISANATGSNLDLSDVNPGSNNATINVTAGSNGGANTSAFGWTGYQF